MLDIVLLVAGGLALAVSANFMKLQRWSITPPLLGLVVGVALGPAVTGVLVLPAGTDVHVLQLAARLLLAVALVAIALRYPLRRARALLGKVVLLLVVVMPAMAAIVAAGGSLVLGLPVGIALVLGGALAPTDPVLASSVVSGKPAEQDIPARPRQLLSLESGANDGLALPMVVIALGVALEPSVAGEVGKAVYEVLGGVVIGVVFGLVAGRALVWAEERREITDPVRSLYTLGLAAAVLGGASLLHTDGLLSVFVAGLVHNGLLGGGDRLEEASVDEALNQFLVLPVFVLFGAVLPWGGWAELGWPGLAFAVGVLALRRLPVLLALRRPLGVPGKEALWLGWFGPIGVAAIFYLGHAHARGLTDPRLWAAGTLVIALSTLVHGLTAGPARVLYRRAGSSTDTAVGSSR